MNDPLTKVSVACVLIVGLLFGLIQACSQPVTPVVAVTQYPASGEQGIGLAVVKDGLLRTGFSYNTSGQVGTAKLTTSWSIRESSEEVLAIRKITVKMTVRGVPFEKTFAPGESVDLEPGADVSDFKIVSITADGWKFTERSDSSGNWDGEVIN